jgi:hypothetical protein
VAVVTVFIPFGESFLSFRSGIRTLNININSSLNELLAQGKMHIPLHYVRLYLRLIFEMFTLKHYYNVSIICISK